MTASSPSIEVYPMRRLVSIALACAAVIGSARADEGMWTYDNFPSALVREKYGANIDQPWLDRVRQATVRLSGCTASFVSQEGLILTNSPLHHRLPRRKLEQRQEPAGRWLSCASARTGGALPDTNRRRFGRDGQHHNQSRSRIKRSR